MTPEEIAADRAVIDAATVTPDELAVHEARHQPARRGIYTVCRTCEGLWPCASQRTATALREAWAANDRLGAMVEWLAEVIVDARDACQRAESIEPSGSPEWVESGIAMRTTALREVRAILDRERNAHPVGLSTRSAVAGNGEFAERAEIAEAQVAALRERIAELEGQLAMRGTP